MPPEDRTRLLHMLEAARDAQRFMQGRTQHDLFNDRQLAYAVERAIQIIGEAAFQMTEAGKGAFSQLPWPEIVGMRHRLVHAYHDIDLEKVWLTVQEDLPELVRALEGKIDSER